MQGAHFTREDEGAAWRASCAWVRFRAPGDRTVLVESGIPAADTGAPSEPTED